MTTPAGWFEDPEQPGGQRYWDGHNWTDNKVAPPTRQSGQPPGWYSDPEQPSGQRYWDGQQWTGDRVDYPAATDTPAAVQPDTAGVTKVKGWHGNVQFDGRTVTIHKAMRGEVTIPLDAINAVTIEHAGASMWAIRFSVGGGTLARPSQVLGSYRDSADDPYSLTFSKGHSLPKFKTLVEEINRARFGA